MRKPATGTEQGQNVVPPAPKNMTTLAQDVANAAPRKVFPAGHIDYLHHCWNEGVDARILGRFRISPYYEDLEADFFWFQGFDGQLGFESTLAIYGNSMETKHEEGN